MDRTFKKVLVWVLFMALPVQGFAAAQMLHCGFTSNPATASEAVDHPASHHHGSSGAVRGHHTTAGTSDHAAKPHHANSHDHGVSKCNHCFPCCAGSMMVSTLYLPVLPAGSLAPASLERKPFTGPVINGPDRPPRHVLA
jgi:hypothetical protein